MFLPGVGIGGRGGTYQGEEECVRAVGMHLYWPKRSFGQGNIFTPVCHSVHRGGVPDQARPPDQAGTRPMTRYTPGTRQVHHPGPGRYTPWDQVHPPGPGRYTPWTRCTPETRQVHPSGTRCTPWDQVGTPPGTRNTPPDQAGTPPGTRYTPLGTRQVHPLGPDRYTSPQPLPPPGSSRLRNTVNDRPVRILLECILVLECFLVENALKLSLGPIHAKQKLERSKKKRRTFKEKN